MIDAATVREQFRRFSRQWDDKSLLADYADLLRRYLSQPLSDSETAWAYQTLANVLACSEHAAEALDVYEAFERWLPGHSPPLSAKFPRFPAPEGSREPAMGPDEIRLEFLSQSVQFATAYGAVGRYADYVAKFDDALARLTPTNENVELRVCAVGISLDASHIAGDFERAERCLPIMHAIADEEPDADSAALLHGRILAWEIQLARARNDAAHITAKLQEALSLLDRLERKGSSTRALGGFRHNLAHHLNQSGRYDLALPVLDAKLAAEGGSHGDHGYAWLMHAAAVWKVTVRHGLRAFEPRAPSHGLSAFEPRAPSHGLRRPAIRIRGSPHTILQQSALHSSYKPYNGRAQEVQMRGHVLASLGILAVWCAVAAFGSVEAQSPRKWSPPRTPWGEPDLQGKWSYATITPLERPGNQSGKEILSDQEVAVLDEEARTDADRRDGTPEADLARAYNAHWYDRGKSIGRTSLIIDPPDGRLPPLTPEGLRRQAVLAEQQRIHPFDSWEDRPLQERCIIYHGVPPLPTGYNNTYQIFQTPGYVAILDENIHDTRGIPLDGRPHIGRNIPQWNGNSRGHWEGTTLVVETTNYSPKTTFRFPVAAETLRAVERFTRVAADRIDYRFTIEDPTTYTRPWTAALPMTSLPDYVIFEYACHEGNYSIRNVLSGARSQEKDKDKSQDAVRIGR